MNFIQKHIRGLVYTFALLLALFVFWYYYSGGLSHDLTLIRLTQTYGFIALDFLYVTLLISPLYANFAGIPYKPLAIKSRRALGLSAFAFSLIHTLYGFFGLFDGFAGFRFLGSSYAYSVILGFIALFILAVLAVTSFDGAIKALGKYWKFLHRFIYMAGFLILLHTVIIGSHFIGPTLTSAIILVGIFLLIILELLRLQSFLVKRYPVINPNLMYTIIILVLLGCGYFLFFSSINAHAKHIHKIVSY